MTDPDMTDSALSDALASLDVARRTRKSVVQIVDALPPDALTVIPPGHSNHVLWNVGHLVVTMQSLVYGLSGLPLGVPDGWLDDFRKGTTPQDGVAAAPYAQVREHFLTLPDQTEADVRAGTFRQYREYRTTPGVVLASVADALRFNLFHEGIHLGTILALRKHLG